MVSKARNGFCWFAGLCGGRKRRQRWQQTPERDVNSPVQPKTARFYGVQPLFTEPSPGPVSRPMSTLSECGTGMTECDKESSMSQSESANTYSDSGRGTPRLQVFGGEKLERLLGESLKTIPEDGRFESQDGCGSWPRTYLLSISSPATTSHGPSTEAEEFELIVQGTSELSVVGGEDWESIAGSTYTRPQTAYTNTTGQMSYTATLRLDDPYPSSHEAIQNFLAAMHGRQSVDCSSMTSEYTDCASWVFRPLQPAPMSYQPQGFYDSQSSSEGLRRSNSANSQTEISTELAFPSGPNSEYGEKRIVLRRMHSSSTFRSRFRSRLVLAGTPDPPMPSAQIPRRTVSIRAVRRKLLEPQAAENRNFPLFTPLRDLRSPMRDQVCQCLPRGLEVRMTRDPAASDVSRVHHWVSGQQQQYENVNPAPSEFLVQFTSIYPIGKPPKHSSGSYTLGSESSVWGDVGSVYGREDFASRAQRPRMVHDGNCPFYDDTLVPVYQEVDPNPVPHR